MKINVELLRKELEFITANRDQWRQSSWLLVPTSETAQGEEVNSCGTVGCLAGWTVVHSGAKVTLDDYSHVNKDNTGSKRLMYGVEYVTINGANQAIHESARQLLGLTGYEASCLFQSSNTLYDMWDLANKFTNGAIEVPVAIQEEEDEANRRWDAQWHES